MTVPSSRTDLSAARRHFPSLARGDGSLPYVFADAPGGTQVPRSVIDAMADYLGNSNANRGGAFVTSAETDAVIAGARRAGADFLNCDPGEVVFGPNMTTLAFALSRSLGRTLGPEDEVVVTMLDHDANIAPWVAAADDSGATVRWVDINEDDCTLDLDSLDSVLGPKTKVLAFTLASNAVGSISAATEIVERARRTDALLIADAVHLAPHRAIDVQALGVDFLFCSPYKFFGPHMGMMFGRRELLDELHPYKVRPSHNDSPDRWETGTSNHEALAGLRATIDYLAGLATERSADGRASIVSALEAVQAHERSLSARFLEGIAQLEGVTLYGISDRARLDERTPTFALRVEGMKPGEVAEELGRRGIFVWDGNYYALAIMERLELEDSGGAVRVGFCHYHTLEEVDRVVAALASLT
jgi:cysteine desulfurase family protein (TIGR01976 family)